MANAVKKMIVFEEAETMKVCERTAQGPVSKKNLLVLRRELTQRRQPAAPPRRGLRGGTCTAAVPTVGY